MKLIDYDKAFVDTSGNALPIVAKECAVDAALAGHQCDAIQLNLVDLARLRAMRPKALQKWLEFMQTKFRISFDPGVVR